MFDGSGCIASLLRMYSARFSTGLLRITWEMIPEPKFTILGASNVSVYSIWGENYVKMAHVRRFRLHSEPPADVVGEKSGCVGAGRGRTGRRH